MPHSADNPPVVRRGASWKSPVILGLAVFILTVLAVQLWERIRHPVKPAKVEPVTAIVEQRPSVMPQPGAMVKSPVSASSKSVLLIHDQVTSLALLRQALCSLDKTANGNNLPSRDVNAEVEKLRQSLKVNLEDSPLGQKCLRLSLVWPNPQEAAQLLKFIGERFSNQYRADWVGEHDWEYLEAKKACESAGHAYFKAADQLEFFEGCLAWRLAAVENAAPIAQEKEPISPLRPPVAAEKTVENSQNQGVENPAWTNLHKKLAAMREKELDLLEKRMPSHPEVRYLHAQIQEADTQLAAIPRWMPNPHPANETTVPKVINTIPISPVQNVNSSRDTHVEDETILAFLGDQVDIASQSYCDAIARERTALGRHEIPPEIVVQIFVPRKIVASTQSERPVAWLAGAVMALGVGLISTGRSIEPPLASVADLNRAISVPVVGVVPSYNPAVNPRAVKRKKMLMRAFLSLVGLIAVGICFVGLYRLL